ncbi:MAG: hypothetical protein GY828_07320 [Candidatus Gracilibacteria bacterium]|nr:hypothetical protein [Candidatus Gracilibacteria bacterium]
MNVRRFELLLVVTLFFIGIYFLAYKYYIPNLCNTYLPKENMDYFEKVSTIGSCKDSIVCNVVDIRTAEGESKIEDWKCERDTVDRFEIEYYKTYFDNLINK